MRGRNKKQQPWSGQDRKSWAALGRTPPIPAPSASWADQLLWEALSQQYSTQSVSCNHYSVQTAGESRAGAWTNRESESRTDWLKLKPQGSANKAGTRPKGCW